MEVKDEDQAAAYLKLQDDVKQLIVDTIYKELQTYGSPLHTQTKATVMHSYDFEQKVKTVIQNQMMK